MPIIAAYMVPHPPLIVPEVGNGGERQIKATSAAYTDVAREISNIRPETIIISSPHAIMCTDYFHISSGEYASGSFAQFGTPQVCFKEKYDEELVKTIEHIAKEENFPAGTQKQNMPELDHGTMVPLYFIRQFFKDFKLVRIGLSGLLLRDHYRMGQIVKKAVEKLKRRAVYVASGDLSHKLKDYGPYGFAPEGPEYDKRVMDVCSRAAFGELLDFKESFCKLASECGHRSFVMMAGALDGMNVETKEYSYEDVTGVGYGICAFHPTSIDSSCSFLEKSLDKENRFTSDPLVDLAKKSIESYVCYKKIMDVPARGLPLELINTRAGAFVSIHKLGKLRGCIGTIASTQKSLAEEIIHNAISASCRDSRFDPIEPNELALLKVNVDVLGEPEDIESAAELDVKRYGVIVTNGSRRGLLLPDIEGVDTVEQQISIAKQKAGIGLNENVTLQRFEVVRHT